MIDRQLMNERAIECLGRDGPSAMMRHNERVSADWELAAGYWPCGQVSDEAIEARRALHQFGEVILRNEWAGDAVQVDSCAIQIRAMRPDGGECVRYVRGVGLWRSHSWRLPMARELANREEMRYTTSQMQWLNTIVDELIARHPEGDIVVSSGVSPSGTYHLGTLREVLTAEVVLREVRRRGRNARHYHVVDDLDIFRKVPVDVPDEFSQYLGKPLCDVPAPDGSDRSYADYFLADLLVAAEGLHLEVEVIRAHEKYRSGYFVSVIEDALENVDTIRRVLEDVSGRSLNEQWSPVQVIEDGYLKNRRFISIQKNTQEITYEDKDGQPRTVSYAHGEVKLNWRIDWPARWSLLGVQAEPFGRDHATKGGSYDTGVEIVRQVFGAEAPYPIPYNFINKTGDTKKMSKSAGDTVTAADLLKLLPPEVLWYFIIRYSPDKLLFFDQGPTLVRLFDEFSELLARPTKTADEQQLIDICLHGVAQPTVSRIPFTHLVASYQAALRDADRTIEVIARTEYADIARDDAAIIRNELQFIDEWLNSHAPDDSTFSLQDTFDADAFSDQEKAFFASLADKVAAAPVDADGEYFHLAIYEHKTDDFGPRHMFQALYRLIIGKTAGPRAGWFLSILPRDWLVKRLRLEA